MPSNAEHRVPRALEARRDIDLRDNRELQEQDVVSPRQRTTTFVESCFSPRILTTISTWPESEAAITKL